MYLINILFQDTLSFLNDHDLLTLAAIVWCVSPNIKQDATLQRQAAFIDQFDPGNIWNNVIIIVKQSLNPSQGKGSFLIMNSRLKFATTYPTTIFYPTNMCLKKLRPS